MAKKSSTRVRKRTRKSYRNEHRLPPPPPPPPTHSSKLWIWALVIFISTQQVVSAVLLRQEFNGANSTGDGSRMAAARFQRDTIKLGKAIDKLGHLTHVANGIALEIGLVDGTIDPGEAVAELLHMGSLTVDDVINLKQENIDKVLDALGHQISPDQTVLDLETRLVNLENMKGIAPAFENQETVTGLKEYKESLGSLPTLKDLEDSVKLLYDDADSIKHLLGKLVPTQKNLAIAANNMNSVLLYMNSLEPLAKSFDSIISNITEVKKIRGKYVFIDTLLAEAHYREVLKNNLDYKTSQPVLEESFAKVYQSSETANNAREDFESIQKLVETRSPFHRQIFKHTHGFPRGPSDLTGLGEDIEHLTDYVPDSKIVKEQLLETLKALSELERKLTATEKQWVGLKSHSKAVNNVIDQIFHLTGIPKTSDVSKLINLLKKCDEPLMKSYPKPDPNDLETFKKRTEALNEAIGKISDFKYIDQFKNLQDVKKYFDVGSKTGKEKDNFVKSTLEKLTTDATLIQFDELVSQLEENLKYLLDFITNSTQGVEFTELNNYLTAILSPQNYKTFLKCLQEIDRTSFPVRDMVKINQDLRGFSVPAEVGNAFKQVSQSKKELTEAKTATEEIKTNPDLPPQIDNLKSSFDKDGYKMIAEKLGLGVQGLIAIRKVREAELKDLLKNVNDMLKDAGEKGLSPEQQTSLKQLEEIPKGLQVFRRKRGAGLQNFHQIFTDAQSVQGATIDMKSLRDAMVKLDEVTTPKYATSMTQLENLVALDLDFSKFSFKDVPTSLTALDAFFLKYATQLSQSPSSSGQKDISLAVADDSEETTPAGGNATSLVIIIGGTLLFLVVIALIIWLIWHYCIPKPPTPDDDSLLPSDSVSQEKEDKKAGEGTTDDGGKKKKDGKKGDDDDGNKDDGSKEGKGKKDDDPKPPPSAGGADPAGGTGPTPPPPPPTDQGGANPPPTDQGNAAPPPPPPPPPPGGANDQAGAPTDKQAAAVPPPGPPPLSDDEALAMVKKCNGAIRLQSLRKQTTPKMWAFNMHLLMVKGGFNLLSKADIAEGQDNKLPYPCIKKTMVKITGFENNFYNCNVFDFGGKKWLVAQGPLDGTVVIYNQYKRDTRPKHHAAIHQNDVGLVMQLCQNFENGVKKCGEYYSEIVGRKVTNGDYEMETMERIDNVEHFTEKGAYVLFKLKSIDTKTKETKPVDLLLYKEWPDQGSPKYAVTALQMLSFADRYNNVLVHSAAGVGRTGTLIAIKTGIELCQRQKVENPNDLINRVRAVRFGSVYGYDQFTYVILAVTKGIMDARGIEYCRDYNEMQYYHENIIKGAYAKYDKGAYMFRPELIDEPMKKDQENMEAELNRKEEEYIAKKEAVGIVVDKEKIAKSGMYKTDGKKQSTSSDAKKVPEVEEKNSKASSVSGESKNKSKKSGKHLKASAASGGSQKKSKKSQKDSKIKAKTSAAPSGSQEKLKKKSTNGEEKKSEEKKKPSAVQKQEKKRSKSKSTKKGGAKA
ncbi:unnamed protein product [Caenorhabditis brenneri]